MAVNLVNVENVSKVYGTRALLDGVSLGVSEGDRIGVVGRNGDGKTTLIRMLAKLEDTDTGRVTDSSAGNRDCYRHSDSCSRDTYCDCNSDFDGHSYIDRYCDLDGDRNRYCHRDSYSHRDGSTANANSEPSARWLCALFWLLDESSGSVVCGNDHGWVRHLHAIHSDRDHAP